ncbi:MAG: hypothetical protein WBD27_18885 [Pyrinomonadaceae bacterium]
MRSGSRNIFISALIIITGFLAVFFLSNFLENNRVNLPETYEDSDLAFQGKRLRGFALGSEGLLADWYWINSLQYIGSKFARTELDGINIEDLTSFNPRLLYPYLDNATDLDPTFMAAYTYGSSILPAIDSQLAITLTEKGISNNPGEWRLYHYLGYIYWRQKDFDKAAEAYEKGSRIGDSPQFMKLMVARMKTQGGSRETARAMYQQMLEGADEQTRSNAEFRLTELDSLDERDAIRTTLKSLKDKTGDCPQSLSQILPLLRSVRLPSGKDFRIDGEGNLVDPSDALYLLDRNSCDVKLDPKKTKMPLN